MNFNESVYNWGGNDPHEESKEEVKSSIGGRSVIGMSDTESIYSMRTDMT